MPPGPPTVFLLSPARLSGQRGKALLNPEADFALARAIRSPAGAPLGSVFSFVSGLYFRGKAAYASAFGRTVDGSPAALVMTAGGGLVPLGQAVNVERLSRWATASISEKNPHFYAPLVRQASELRVAQGESTRFVLLGSVATNKYVEPLVEVFGQRLLFPREFAGRGDMSRGSLLLRAVREQEELAYAPIAQEPD